MNLQSWQFCLIGVGVLFVALCFVIVVCAKPEKPLPPPQFDPRSQLHKDFTVGKALK